MFDFAHGDTGHVSAESLLSAGAIIAAGVCAVGYVVRSSALRARGVHWPLSLDAAFVGGCVALAAGAAWSLPAMPFTGHMAQHLLVGMVAPFLIVVGRPVTLLLRTFRVGSLRTRVLRVLHSRAARLAVFPPVAAAASIVGIWALYRTPLFAATHDHPWLHAAVHVHLVVSGTLFTAAVCQLDPVRRRYGLTLRAATLIATGAAHAVLAKSLYAWPPPSAVIARFDLQLGAQLMYYGGDAVEIAIAVVLAVSWYAAGGRAFARQQRRTAAG